METREPSTWFDGSGYQGSGLQFTWHGTAEGVKTGGAAVGSPFGFDRWNGGKYRCQPGFGTSRTLADIGRDSLLSAAIPNIGIWAENPLMDEIGQKTMRIAPETGISAIERGQQLFKEVDWVRALLPEGAGWRLGVGKTFLTGPTLGGWLGDASAQGTAWYNKKNDLECTPSTRQRFKQAWQVQCPDCQGVKNHARTYP